MSYDWVESAPLDVEVHENVLLVPTASRTVYRDIRAGVFDEKGACLESSMLTRTWTPPEISIPPDISRIDRSKLQVVDEPHIYGGFFFDHFGHFVLESLARLWACDHAGPMPIAWVCGGPPNRWQSEILGMLNVDAHHRFPDRPVVFRRLIIPQPGYRIQTFFHPDHARFLAGAGPVPSHVVTAPAPPRKVWLSRTELSDRGRRSPGEERLQRILSKRGWLICHPQRLAVSQQIATIAGASIVAGLQGSAFHTIALSDAIDTPLVVLRRTRSPNFETIARRKDIVEFDLFGAWRINRRRRFQRLHQPVRWAHIIDELADRVAEADGNRDELQRMKDTYESTFDYETWDRAQAGRHYFRLEDDVRYLWRKASRRFLGRDVLP